MNIIQHDVVPNTEDWERLRIAKFTGSNAHRLMTEPRSNKDKEAGVIADGAMTYIYEKVDEAITGISAETDISGLPAIEWGLANEIHAKDRLRMMGYKIILENTFYTMGDIAGCTTDAETEDCVIEIKCPHKRGQHLRYRDTIKDSDSLKSEYPQAYWQVMLEMIVTKKKKAIFASYDPRLPDEINIHIVHVEYSVDDSVKLISNIRRASDKMLSMIEELALVA